MGETEGGVVSRRHAHCRSLTVRDGFAYAIGAAIAERAHRRTRAEQAGDAGSWWCRTERVPGEDWTDVVDARFRNPAVQASRFARAEVLAYGGDAPSPLQAVRRTRSQEFAR